MKVFVNKNKSDRYDGKQIKIGMIVHTHTHTHTHKIKINRIIKKPREVIVKKSKQ